MPRIGEWLTSLWHIHKWEYYETSKNNKENFYKHKSAIQNIVKWKKQSPKEYT